MNEFDKHGAKLMNALTSTGIFVTCGYETPNIMVTHWGTFGNLWGRQIFTLPVRSTKYSYQIINKTISFALNLPNSDMRTEISLCDTMSGFKCNKFEVLGLHTRKAKSIDSYVLGTSGLVAEFKVIATIDPADIKSDVDNLFLSKRPHTLFIGEIVDCYNVK